MRIGIAGSGKIVRELLDTIAGREEIVCTAVCVRPQSKGRGELLSREYGIPAVYTDYSHFLADGAYDFVYIGIVNSLHFDYARRALLAGRNVILEKPFTATAAEACELEALATERGRYLFEAITNLYGPCFRFVRDRLPQIGEVKLVQCNYSQYSSRYDDYLLGRVAPAFDPALYGGALYDINIYNLHIVLALFGSPDTIRYRPNRGHNGVDTSGTALLEYGGFHALCTGAKDSESPGFIVIQGTKGYLRILGAPNACPFAESVAGGAREECANHRADRRMAAALEAFDRMWQAGDLAECHRALRHSVRVMEALEQAHGNIL